MNLIPKSFTHSEQRQRHKNAFDPSLGSEETEFCPAIVNQVELHVSATAKQLPLSEQSNFEYHTSEANTTQFYSSVNKIVKLIINKLIINVIIINVITFAL